MIKNRTFELVPHVIGSSWTSTDEFIKYVKSNLNNFLPEEAVWDKNFDEPMNYLTVKIPNNSMNPTAFAKKLDELFGDFKEDICIEVLTDKVKRISHEHCWFTKTIQNNAKWERN